MGASRGHQSALAFPRPDTTSPLPRGSTVPGKSRDIADSFLPDVDIESKIARAVIATCFRVPIATYRQHLVGMAASQLVDMGEIVWVTAGGIEPQSQAMDRQAG